MSIEILYLAKNRLEFTKASFRCLIQNTNWDLVSNVVIYDDGSIDGTREYLRDGKDFAPVPSEVLCSNKSFGGPASIMADYVQKSKAELFIKIDNDVMVPPDWLDEGLIRMERCPNLDLLGIEPPASRTPHYHNGPRSLQPELDHNLIVKNLYAPCDSIGGIGLMRRSAFLKHPDLIQHSIYGGFTEWQLSHRDIIKGWIAPPLNVFLLDRMRLDPWKSLAIEYIAKGWQRAWTQYPLDNPFWNWYKP